MNAFSSQEEAVEYVKSIVDPIERVMVEGALSIGMGISKDKRYRGQVQLGHPLDLRTYVQAVHLFFQEHEICNALLSGCYKSFDDVIFGEYPARHADAKPKDFQQLGFPVRCKDPACKHCKAGSTSCTHPVI